MTRSHSLLLAAAIACGTAPPPPASAEPTAAPPPPPAAPAARKGDKAMPASPVAGGPRKREEPAHTARCRVRAAGVAAVEGPCVLSLDGDNGSFFVTPADGSTYNGTSPVSVTIIEPRVAEVRGMTSDGINSRWGMAKRVAEDPACWTGSDFEVCAWANATPE